ncbi:MAG: hypothetical protein QM532_04265 [Cyanobium sp. MAG06]|nr:hypothetical protein [Cyanobium sp. MAG06]
MDYIEEKDGGLFAFECKYKDRSSRGINNFLKNYPEAKMYNVSRDNYLDLVV